jgi:hypothetical protein
MAIFNLIKFFFVYFFTFYYNKNVLRVLGKIVYHFKKFRIAKYSNLDNVKFAIFILDWKMDR